MFKQSKTGILGVRSMGPEYLGMPSTAKKSQSYGHFPYLPYGFIKSQDILLKSPNHEYRRGKMWLDVGAKYLIVWVVGNSLHVAHRVRGLQSVHLLPPPIHPRLFSTSNSWTLLGVPLTSGCTHTLHCLYLLVHLQPQPKYILFCFYQCIVRVDKPRDKHCQRHNGPRNLSNLFNARWRHLSKSGHMSKSWLTGSCISPFQICNISKNLICISFKYAFPDLLQVGSKFGHQVTSHALVPKLATRLCHLHCHIALECPFDI